MSKKPQEGQYVRLTIRVTPKQDKMLTRTAKLTGQSASYVIRELISTLTTK